jgi:hypothetical protein
MKKLNLLLWLLPLAILSIAQCRHENTEAYHEAGYQLEEKIYDNPAIEDNFDGSSVLVVMDKRVGGINKSHKMSFFGSFEMEYIKDLTEITGDIDSKKYLNKEQFHQILMIKLPKDSKENVLNVIRQLEKVDGIRYASPNYYFYPAAVPNDPHYDPPGGGQWGLKGTCGIRAPAAWDITTGAKGIMVGILDSGIGPHPDLDAHLLPGFNFEDYNDDTNDTTGHGTQVAGIVGAVGNNNTGIAGVCWNVSLVPLVIGNNARYLFDRIISAISFAISADIGILNFSQGNFEHQTNIALIKDAVQNYSGLFVAAAGNENTDMSNNSYYFKNFYSDLSQLNHVIIVGAIASSGNRWDATPSTTFPYGSNYSNTIVHLFAPGADIRTTYYDDYEYVAGTSIAAPHVAGAAALLLSLNPFLTAAQIKTVILNNVTVSPALSDLCTTGGRLNVQQALNSQGTVVGFFDIKYHNAGVSEVIGRFYLFNDGRWTFVERGFRSNPKSIPVTYPFAYKLQAGPVPVAIGNYLGNRTINTPVEVLLPSTDPRFGIHYAGITVNFQITSAGVTITDLNYDSIRPVGADSYSYIFKIANKQGSL